MNIFSKLSSKSIAKVFIDEASGRILDNLHKLTRNYSGSKKEADKLLKSIIKTIVKVGILYRNDLFTEYELKLIENFRNRFHSLSKAIVTFYEVDFTFDRVFLTRMCKDCQDLTHQIISTHLTTKSHARIDYVFNTISNLQFLEYVFNPNLPTNRAIIKEIVENMNSLMDAGLL
jgi:transcription termination factor NusB